MHTLDFTHPIADLVGLLSFIIFSVAPLYCGWRILDRRTVKKPLATTTLEKVFGVVTSLLGISYGTLLCYWLGSAVHDSLFDWIKGNPGPQQDWAMILGVGVPFFTIIASILWGVTFCGANLCTTRLLAQETWVRWKFLSDRDTRQIFMGTCSLITGVVGFIMVLADFVA